MTCLLCTFEVDEDDVQMRNGRFVVCVRCYMREVGRTKFVPKGLRRELDTTLTGITEVVDWWKQ